MPIIHIIRESAVLDQDWRVYPGDIVQYLGYVPGGKIRIRTADGREGVIYLKATQLG
jgi:hypothetical protein